MTSRPRELKRPDEIPWLSPSRPPDGKRKAGPTIERRYVPQMDACTDALELLKKRGRLPDKSGPEDPERRSDEIRAKTSKPR